MKFKTILIIILLSFVGMNATSCASNKIPASSGSVEDAEKAIAKKRAEEEKAAKKARKRAEKEYWKLQTKSAHKSVKKNRRRQKRIARHNKRKYR